MLWMGIKKLLVKNYMTMHIVLVLDINCVTENNLSKVYKYQNHLIQNGHYGKDSYSGLIEMYVLLYHLVLSHMVKDMLELN